MSTLHETAKAMVAAGKGILAADESNSTAGKRLASIQVESTPDSRRQYREIFLGLSGVGNYLSGVILYDETIRQTMSTGEKFTDYLQKVGVIPGIKVDKGLCDLPNFPGEQYTAGLDGLPERLAEYYAMGARFAKWRSVITISDTLPTEQCLHVNAHGMAMYALMCQQAGIVPIVEPEVLLDGTHTIERCYEVTSRTLKILFMILKEMKVDLSGLVLKTSMVISGKNCQTRADGKTVGEMTLKCLKENVPAEVGGIVFLSGGQGADEACENLYEINAAAQRQGAPWQLTFSYARALQGPSLEVWAGNDANLQAARAEFEKRLQAVCKARAGEK